MSCFVQHTGHWSGCLILSFFLFLIIYAGLLSAEVIITFCIGCKRWSEALSTFYIFVIVAENTRLRILLKLIGTAMFRAAIYLDYWLYLAWCQRLSFPQAICIFNTFSVYMGALLSCNLILNFCIKLEVLSLYTAFVRLDSLLGFFARVACPEALLKSWFLLNKRCIFLKSVDWINLWRLPLRSTEELARLSIV